MKSTSNQAKIKVKINKYPIDAMMWINANTPPVFKSLL